MSINKVSHIQMHTKYQLKDKDQITLLCYNGFWNGVIFLPHVRCKAMSDVFAKVFTHFQFLTLTEKNKK